jgi:hypothetical protein
LLGVVLALVAVLAVPTAALAAVTQTGETTVTGEVPTTYTLTVPTSIPLPSLVPGTTVTSASGYKLNLDSNVDGTITLTVRDKEQTDHIGQMYCTAESYALVTPLKVKGGHATTDGSQIANFTPLPTGGGTALIIVDGKSITAGVTYEPTGDLYVQQVVEALAKPGSYSLTLYFTATFS